MSTRTDEIRAMNCTDVPTWARQIVAELLDAVDERDTLLAARSFPGTGRHRLPA